MSEQKKQAMTAAERQRASRAARKTKTCDTFMAKQISLMLSPEASKALVMLVHKSDLSQKQIIDKLLTDAYQKQVNE